MRFSELFILFLFRDYVQAYTLFTEWFDSNFTPRNSKKFEYWNFDSTIRIYIENEQETQKHEIPWLSNSLKFLNFKFWNFNALLWKYCFSNLKSDWLIWKRASRSCPLGIMKVYYFGYNMDFHDSTKLVKSAFIQNQKP